MTRSVVLPVPENGSNLPPMVGAVIYVRVSDQRQAENLSLATQLRTCEEYCRRQGFEVLERFKEQGESAKTADRTELQKLLQYCRTHKGKVQFVVVFNLTRFAREKYDHFALRAHLKSLGISLRSATEPIDDTATGKLMEGVLAAFAQFDNDCRSDRTRAGMRAALELGRWTFLAPIGYLNAPRAMGKSLMADPERAPLVRRAFEEYATGRFTKEQLLKPAYGVRGKRGDFEPLISENLVDRMQSVPSGRVPSTAPRQPAHPDFPRHAFVRGVDAGSPAAGRKTGTATTVRNDASRTLGPRRISDSSRTGWPSPHPRTR